MLTVLVEYTREALCVAVRSKMNANDVLDALHPLLIKHGKPCPKKKNPIKADWRNQPVSAEDALAANQMLQHNIGILNGTTSGLIDIDLDCAEAVAFADLFLPEIVASFGHEGNDRGHYLAAIKSSGKSRKFNLPDSSECLVELRSDGTQTMLHAATLNPPKRAQAAIQLY